MQGICVNLYLNKSTNNLRALKCTKTTGMFLYENHKNDRFRMFGAPKCCPGKAVVLECVSEADETICTGWEVIAH